MPTLASACLHVAGTDQEPVGPPVELGWIAQVGQITPCAQQGLLHGILGKGRIPQDPVGHAEKAIRNAVHDRCEGPLVPPHRTADEVGVQRRLQWWRLLVGAFNYYGAAR